ncbi:hypothetical protein CHS0354_040412 [Potamilus streckersoni]|uniref:Ig-like domain-containing protein n=1 Tax=Potamilus streckersoni TaxID=2493646 RepID=A0AAE0W4X2_9BIVA|nr:hypothetical protein CHS0354_040412 [Potamilus streckersoni]
MKHLSSERKEKATIYDVQLDPVEGRTVQAIIGRNVSFSFVFTNITKDGGIFIRHDMSPFFSLWPDKKFHFVHKETENVRVSADMSRDETFKVTVNFLNITSSDAGLYTVTQQLNSDKFDYGVLLQMINSTQIPRIAIARYNLSDSSLVLQCVSDKSYPANVSWKLNASLIRNMDEYLHNNDYLSIRNLTNDHQYNSFTCWEQESGLESDTYRLTARE